MSLEPYPYPTARERGRIFGTVIQVGGTGDRIPVLIESDGEPISGCHASRDVAKALARYQFEPVRLVGKGSWLRAAEGRWELQGFNIDAFEPVERTTISEALSELRAVAGDWTEEDYRNLQRIRHGPHQALEPLQPGEEDRHDRQPQDTTGEAGSAIRGPDGERRS